MVNLNTDERAVVKKYYLLLEARYNKKFAWIKLIIIFAILAVNIVSMYYNYISDNTSMFKINIVACVPILIFFRDFCCDVSFWTQVTKNKYRSYRDLADKVEQECKDVQRKQL